jgi:hypothetical protein
VNIFEYALCHGETNDFFLGYGKYFFRNRETHGHSFYMNVENIVIAYVKHGEFSKINCFIDKFKEFIELSDDSHEKYIAILKNSYAICDIVKKTKQYSCNNSSVRNIEISIYNYFLRTKFHNDNLLDLYLERIESTLCTKISTAIKGNKYTSKE